jgi:hypothetical protein
MCAMRSSARPLALAAIASIALVLTACSALPARSDGDADDDSPLVSLQLSGSAARYLAIAQPANVTLDVAFDGLADDDNDVSTAVADFRVIARTERAFDRDLLALALPPATRATARELVAVNEARATITEQAAASRTQAEVESYEQDIDVANEVVEYEVGLLRSQLGLPPPDSS